MVAVALMTVEHVPASLPIFLSLLQQAAARNIMENHINSRLIRTVPLSNNPPSVATGGQEYGCDPGHRLAC